MFARVIEVLRKSLVPSIVSVEFVYKFESETQEIRDLNVAFGKITNGNAELRFNLFVHVFSIWVKGSMAYLLGENSEKVYQVQAMFGECFKEHGLKKLMYTLTSDGSELRVWYGPYRGSVDSLHVDSFGSGNLLLDINGKRGEVAKYLNALQNIFPLERKSEIENVEIYI